MVRHWNCCKCGATLARDEVADWRLKPGSRIEHEALCENCVCEECAVNDISETLPQFLKVVRVPYGRADTKPEDREYRMDGVGPVGTVKDWQQYACERGYDGLHIYEPKDGITYVQDFSQMKPWNKFSIDR